jgi:hypothetical protein
LGRGAGRKDFENMNTISKKREGNRKKMTSTVDREAVRVLAIELGAREAARRLGIKESTVLSWARRHGWKLPKRKGGGSGKNALTLAIKPGDALIAKHKELEDTTKTALMQTLAKAARQVAGKDALDVSNTAQLRDICLAAARIFGWKDEPPAEVNITNQVGVVCNEPTRQQLIELFEKRQQILHGATTTAQSPGGLTENSNEQTSAPQTPVGLKRLPTNPAEPSPAESNPATEYGSDTWGNDHPDLDCLS